MRERNEQFGRIAMQDDDVELVHAQRVDLLDHARRRCFHPRPVDALPFGATRIEQIDLRHDVRERHLRALRKELHRDARGVETGRTEVRRDQRATRQPHGLPADGQDGHRGRAQRARRAGLAVRPHQNRVSHECLLS